MTSLARALCCCCRLARRFIVARTGTRWASKCTAKLRHINISTGRLLSTSASAIRIGLALMTRSLTRTNRHYHSSSKVAWRWANVLEGDGWSLGSLPDSDVANSSTSKPAETEDCPDWMGARFATGQGTVRIAHVIIVEESQNNYLIDYQPR